MLITLDGGITPTSHGEIQGNSDRRILQPLPYGPPSINPPPKFNLEDIMIKFIATPDARMNGLEAS